MRVVLDTSVVVSGIGWRTESNFVLGLLARREFISCRTKLLTEEWVKSVQKVSTQPSWRNKNWANWLNWLKQQSKLVEDIPAAKKISRDKNDDPIVMAAISARANFMVTKDPDLLALGKPYGIACVTPREFLSVILRNG